MSQFIKLVEANAESLEGRGALEAYAAKAAIDVLMQNWRQAIRDGYKPSDLLGDIGRTIDHLRDMQVAVESAATIMED